MTIFVTPPADFVSAARERQGPHWNTNILAIDAEIPALSPKKPPGRWKWPKKPLSRQLRAEDLSPVVTVRPVRTVPGG